MRKVAIGFVIVMLAVVFGLIFSSIIHADRPTEEEQIELLSEQLLQSTVQITPFLDKGSGFYISVDQILTNEHVIRKAGDTVKFRKYDGSECEAHVGYREEGWDMAVLSTACKGTPLILALNNPKRGSTVIAAGNPDGFEFFLTKGIVSAYGSGWLQFDAWIDKGSSGGPLVNVHNEVVGITTAKAKDYQGIGLAVPVDDVRRFIRRSGVNVLANATMDDQDYAATSYHTARVSRYQ